MRTVTSEPFDVSAIEQCTNCNCSLVDAKCVSGVYRAPGRKLPCALCVTCVGLLVFAMAGEHDEGLAFTSELAAKAMLKYRVTKGNA